MRDLKNHHGTKLRKETTKFYALCQWHPPAFWGMFCWFYGHIFLSFGTSSTTLGNSCTNKWENWVTGEKRCLHTKNSQMYKLSTLKKINKLSIIFCLEILLPKTGYENILGKKYDYLVENAYENKVLFGARRGKCWSFVPVNVSHHIFDDLHQISITYILNEKLGQQTGKRVLRCQFLILIAIQRRTF